MSIPAKQFFNRRELTRLAGQGITPSRFFPSTGEVLCLIDGAPYAYAISDLKRRARPSLRERLIDWLAGRAA
ncbi:hypothetical protein RSO41_13460 [Halomonas sp. I1]|uniref:hypothetical protein n=1 Tax=Halomonas sp. I1 TaxID=393536 RepID=UPI0028DEE65D|nr:hypothetical protein [Halomonas sp. I1]MDT8895659.1 hypothetical protein [Halomonas sp. I1]